MSPYSIFLFIPIYQNTSLDPALGTKTETETVERALELVVFQEDALKAFQELCEKGEVEDVVGHAHSRAEVSS